MKTSTRLPAARQACPAKPITAPLRAARAFDNALALVLDRQRMDREGRSLLIHGDADTRLIGLVNRLHQIGGDVAHIHWAEPGTVERELSFKNLRFCLANLAAYALIWATPNQPNYVKGCKALAERRRQLADEFGSGGGSRNFRRLLEECGMVAHQITEVEVHDRAESNLHAQLLTVAAVCVAWLEILESIE